MMARRRFAQIAGFAALVAAVGCGGGDGGSYATVAGTVTQSGKPLDGAKVTFHSTAEVDGARAGVFSALTDSSGKYLLASVGKDPGIPPGMYKVTITKLEMKGGTQLPEDFDQGQLEASGMARNKLPKEYESLATTKLSVTLQEGKNEDVNFDIKAGKASGGIPEKTP